MSHTAVLRANALQFSLFSSLLLILIGCGPKAEITSYTVAKPKSGDTSKTKSTIARGPDKIRMLAVLIPDGQSFWSVKFMGRIEKISKHENEFDAFVETIRLSGEGKDRLKYQASPNWKVGPPSEFRTVSFTLAADAPELVVSTPIQGTILSNVNRWREQVGLPKLDESELPAEVKTLMVDGIKFYRVDLRGPGASGGPKM